MVGGEEAERSLAVTQKKFLGGQNKLSTALCSCSSKFLCLNFHLDKSGSFKKQVLSLWNFDKIHVYKSYHFPLILLISYLAFSCKAPQYSSLLPYGRKTQCSILP